MVRTRPASTRYAATRRRMTKWMVWPSEARDQGRASVRNVIKQRRRPERPPVPFRIPVPADRIKMIPRGIALMTIKTVPRVLTVQLHHDPVAGDFGQNRGGGDGGGPAVASDHGSLGNQEVRHAK